MPRLAVNMMVVNGEQVLRRCLMPLKGAIDELVVVDTGSTDNTKKVLDGLASEMCLSRFHYVLLSEQPGSFFLDEKDSWQQDMPGPFTGLPIPKDWAAVRNLALDNTTADYVIKLDADDEPICPTDNWLRTADYLDTVLNFFIVSAPYEVYDGKGNLFWLSMYDRLWRRGSGLRWTMPFHEYLHDKTTANFVYTPFGLRVRDWRDSPGVGVRIAHRNLKVLLREYEHMNRCPLGVDNENGVSFAGCFMHDFIRQFTLAHEAVDVFPELAHKLLQSCIEYLWLNGSSESPDDLDDLDKGTLSDCHYHLGRLFEHTGDVQGALDNYAQADEYHPNLQALVKMFLLAVKHKSVNECRKLHSDILSKLGTDLLGHKHSIDDAVPFNCNLMLLNEVRNWKAP